MKSLKAAAVVAGSIAIAGAATPAFAYDAADVTPSSLNGAVDTVLSHPLEVEPPLQQQSNALDTENKDSLLNTVNGLTKTLNSPTGPTQLLGGLPLQG
ncbi:hypothetical protein [Streptomyces heilongjiangensis]|uniref:Secreted protein n=1 Tax=Streptomyces heilongjiangensis TaxID=945052 RepID=A0ABW1B690_9ACTN|nr:hypothetical protein [Streptomyces heilongjiangensis]MDC2949235.1 hypothetical protein [Streptomyces heilongjiangensis]